MLVGTANATAMVKIGPTAPGCPFTFQSRGVVTDMDLSSSTYGVEFVLSAQHIRINTPGQEEGCTTLFQTVTLTPKR